MKKTERAFSSSELRTVNLDIESYEEKTMVGKLRSPLYQSEQSFNGTTQLLMMVDQLLCLAEQEPQSPMPYECGKYERFSGRGDNRSAPLAQFSIQVLYKQNTSWQGTVYWLDNKTETHFRSVCELLILLDGALTEALASRAATV